MSLSPFKQYHTFFFALNELQPLTMDVFAADFVHRRAYEQAELNISSMTAKKLSGEFASFQLNPDDVYVEERDGVLAWGLQVESDSPLNTRTVQELRDFFERCYVSAAVGTGVSVRYVNTERFHILNFKEMSSVDFV